MPLKRLNRRRFQYSLLLLVFMLANIAMAWFFPRWGAARRQREAVAAIRAMGGHVTYDHEARWNAARAAPMPAKAPPGPAWARKLLGEDFFADAVVAGYRFPPAMNDRLARARLRTPVWSTSERSPAWKAWGSGTSTSPMPA